MTKGPQTPQARLRLAAMNALARREHSRLELERKLAAKHGDEEPVMAAVLDRLEEEGLLSDSRFAEAFARSRVRRGQGPVRIRAELRQRGVDDAAVSAALKEADTDWLELAAAELVKRFGPEAPREARDKARRMRFLQQRGFSGDIVREALEAVCRPS